MSNAVQTTTTLVFAQPAPTSDDIKAVAATLGSLAGGIGESEWMILRLAIKNLMAAARQVETMERTFPVPQEEA